MDLMDIVGGGGRGSTSASPCSSYQPSPCVSYNPSPTSSSFPSPVRSSQAPNPDPNSLIPWLKNLSSNSPSSSSNSKLLPHHLYLPGGSISAPVTPPLSSPTARSRAAARARQYLWSDSIPNSSMPFFGVGEVPLSGPPSPTYSLVARNNNSFGLMEEALSRAGSRLCTPGQSGQCTPVIPAEVDGTSDIPMPDSMAAEFAFGNSQGGLVKAWEGERIHEECGCDDLELTLGNSGTR